MYWVTVKPYVTVGLSLVVGILVDDSIVVLENIYSHIEKGESPGFFAACRKRNRFICCKYNLVIVVVFLPILFVAEPLQIF
jgi:HAE1 family hydrophobic/amphiphilic exporter-1